MRKQGLETLILYGAGPDIKILDLATQKSKILVTEPDSRIVTLSLTPDNQILYGKNIGNSFDRSYALIKLDPFNDFKKKEILHHKYADLTSIATMSNGKILYSRNRSECSAEAHELRSFDSSKLIKDRSVKIEPKYEMVGLSLISDYKILYGSGRDLKIFDMKEKKEIILEEEESSFEYIYTTNVFSEGKILYGGNFCKDGEKGHALTLFDLETKKYDVLIREEGAILSSCVLPNKDILYSTYAKNNFPIVLYSNKKRKVLTQEKHKISSMILIEGDLADKCWFNIPNIRTTTDLLIL